ncbi:MAG TPA: hypothetical protein ENL08_01315, partial [Bacteroidetes bacterium]|nr:hypothetical protein [Bacteroidota bacterium]
DLSTVNLECPLIDKQSPIEKTGPVLGVGSDCVNGLRAASIGAANLANNHILDHGSAGLLNTLQVCDEAGITTFGAGRDIHEAGRIVVRDVKGCRIGLLGMAEHEFSTASHRRGGANPLDLKSFIRSVDGQRSEFDYLIVLLHGGNEGYPYPSPRLMDTCRFLTETGADAVICQHSHCPGCHENHHGSHIVYGQGNLIFDLPDREASWYEGFLVRLEIAGDFSSTMSLVPYVQSGRQAGAGRMNPGAEEALLNRVEERSGSILEAGFVEEAWSRFCADKRCKYLNDMLMPCRLLKFLNRRGLVVNLFYSRKFLMRLLNLVRCQAHREVVETILRRYQRGTGE